LLEFSYLCFLLFLLIFILCIGKNNLTLSPKKIYNDTIIANGILK